MVDEIRNALDKHKQILESSRADTCDVYEQVYVFDPVTKTKKKTEVKVLSDIPCKLSYKNNVTSAKPDDLVSSSSKQVELFTSANVYIKAGSKIVVFRDSAEIEFSRSSEPDTHFSHKRYALEKFKGYL